MTTRTKGTGQTEPAATINRLLEKKGEYIERLDIGAAKIEEARGQGRDVTVWEDYWIQLLRQLKAVEDKIRDLQKA